MMQISFILIIEGTMSHSYMYDVTVAGMQQGLLIPLRLFVKSSSGSENASNIFRRQGLLRSLSGRW